MKKIYPRKVVGPVILLLRSITAFAKKHAAEAQASHESGNQLPNLKHILNYVAVGITTERIANFSLTAKPAEILVPSLTANGKAVLCFTSFIQFTHLESRSLN
jgi:hypothetical protein